MHPTVTAEGYSKCVDYLPLTTLFLLDELVLMYLKRLCQLSSMSSALPAEDKQEYLLPLQELV